MARQYFHIKRKAIWNTSDGGSHGYTHHASNKITFVVGFEIAYENRTHIRNIRCNRVKC